jgi:hypothetical protein
VSFYKVPVDQVASSKEIQPCRYAFEVVMMHKYGRELR